MTPHVASAVLVAADSGSSRGIVSVLYFVPFVVVVAMLIAKNRRARQEHTADAVQSLVAGDEVMTAGGLFGVVSEVVDDKVIMEIAPGVNVRYLTAAVSRIPPPQQGAEQASFEDDQSPHPSA